MALYYDENPNTQRQQSQQQGGASRQSGMTFSQMQRQGYARPPRPPMEPNGQGLGQGPGQQPPPPQGPGQGMPGMPGQPQRPQPQQPPGPQPQQRPQGAQRPQQPQFQQPSQFGGAAAMLSPQFQMQNFQGPQPQAQPPQQQQPQQGGGGGMDMVPGGIITTSADKYGNSPWGTVPTSTPQQQPGQGWPDIGPTLYNQWATYQNPTPFNYGGNTSQGYNQQYQPVGTPQAGPQQRFQAQSNPTDAAFQQALQQGIQNPSGFNSQQMLGMFDAANNRLSQEFDVQRQYINEDAARRGLSFSTVPQGRLGDVAVRQSQAQTDMMQNLLGQAGMTYGADNARMLGLGLQNSGQGFNQQLGQFGANLGAQGQNFQQQLAGATFGAGQNQQAWQSGLQQQGFNNAAQQQNWQNALGGYQANLGANQQGFDQRQALLGNMLGYGQQQYNNQLSTAQFNLTQDQANQQMQQMWLQLLGAGA